MSATDPWALLGGSDAGDLAEARAQAHYAAQWPARAARGYAEPRANDSHTSLVWGEARQALTGQPLKGGERLALRLNPLTLEWLGTEGEEACVLNGVKEAAVEAWLRGKLELAGYDPAALAEPLPYALPDHGVTRGEAYQMNAAASTALAAWFSCAAEVLAWLAGVHVDIRPGPSPVRCWPHHFDIASLILLDEGGGEDARSIGVGFSPGDETFNEPYYYVTPPGRILRSIRCRLPIDWGSGIRTGLSRPLSWAGSWRRPATSAWRPWISYRVRLVSAAPCLAIRTVKP